MQRSPVRIDCCLFCFSSSWECFFGEGRAQKNCLDYFCLHSVAYLNPPSPHHTVSVCVCVCVHVHICLFIKGKNGKVFYYYPAFLGFFLWFHLLRVEKWRNFIIKAIGAILRERVKKDEHHQECQSQRSRGNSEDHLRDQRLGSSLMGAEAKGIHCTSNVIQSPCLMLSTSTSSYLNVTFSSIKIQSLYSASKTYPTYFHPECFLWQICSFWTRNRSFLHFTSQP